jgi:hypothetical protein
MPERVESMTADMAIGAAEAREDAERLKIGSRPDDANDCQELLVYAERVEADLEAPLNFLAPTETIAGEPPAGEQSATEEPDKRVVTAIRNPSLTKATAHLRTLRLAEDARVCSEALALADEIKAHGGIDRLLAHQMAAAHRAAMTLVGRVNMTHIASEAAHNANSAARMMAAFQGAALTLNELRKGKRGRMKYTVEKTVYHVKGGASGARDAETEARPEIQKMRKTR